MHCTYRLQVMSAVIRETGSITLTCALTPKLLGCRRGFDTARWRSGRRRVTGLGLSDLSPHWRSMDDGGQREEVEEEVELHDIWPADEEGLKRRVGESVRRKGGSENGV